MKVSLIILLLFFSISFAQEKKEVVLQTETKIFSFSPLHSKVKQVNGLVMGVGHYQNSKIKHQTINGLNIDVIHPAPVLLMSFGLHMPFQFLVLGLTHDEILVDYGALEPTSHEGNQLTMNGLNLSVGGFMNETNFNGLNISAFSATNKCNGVSIAPVFNGSVVSNGLQIGSLANYSARGNGVQIGISNVSDDLHGIQIGLFNKTENQRGIQLGLWNRNAKRSLPFINWQFKG